MSNFDDFVQKNIEKKDVPLNVKKRIKSVFNSLPDENIESFTKKKHRRRIVLSVASVALFALVLMPNMSSVYANALNDIPVIGKLIKVVTVRSYFYEDDKKELNVSVPSIGDKQNSNAENQVNKDVDELIGQIVDCFYEEYNKNANDFKSVDVTYDVITNTDRWFTLRLNVVETAASSRQYYKFYNIDRENDRVVKLSDLFEDKDYKNIISDDIKRQMREQMDSDSSISYWIKEEDVILGGNFTRIEDDHNFYVNDIGNIVIVFDEGDVAPSSMGTVEFEIKKAVLEECKYRFK